jgi:hypothetical protein
VKTLAIAVLGWAACVLALGVIARVMWVIFMIGWGVI